MKTEHFIGGGDAVAAYRAAFLRAVQVEQLTQIMCELFKTANPHRPAQTRNAIRAEIERAIP
jgi:hypothetical protein